MASYKLNVARIRSSPPPAVLAEAMESFGLPETEEFGVLNSSATDHAVFATIVRKTHQTVQRLDADAREVMSAAVEKVNVYPFGIRPKAEILEVYAGPAGAIEQVGLFLGSCLALPTIVEPIELDIPSAIAKLRDITGRFQLRSVRLREYAHDSYTSGAYAPKFLDSDRGHDFLAEYAETVVAAKVRFAGATGRVNVNLSPKACFAYSCNEDDQSDVQSILRKLL